MVDRFSVRMYEVGFGDCFLIQLWTGDRVDRVLIDCGSITQGQAQVDRVVQDVIKTCRDPDNTARIALVAATHRHKDHVGGFANAAWNEVEVGEVWMPWTEDPEDANATRIRNRQSSLALSLVGTASDEDPLADAPSNEPAAQAALRAERATALNALTNEKAMATLHGGFATHPKPVFLPLAGKVCEARTIAGVDGVTVHVLGPPRDEAALAIMDPPSGRGYLADDAGAAGPAHAFGSHWRLDEKTYRATTPGTTFSRDDLLGVNRNAEQPDGALAAALDNAINNTSLILMFEVAGQWLLFAADAQWGSWNAAMKDPASRAVLARTTFYKVGHHGSHNATPRELIEDLIPGPFTAMVSTCHVKQWPNIPRGPLIDAMALKPARMARSDMDGEAAKQGFTVEAGLYVEWAYPPPAGAPKGALANTPKLASIPKKKPKAKTGPTNRKP